MNKLDLFRGEPIPARAMEGFAQLMTHVCDLYTMGESGSVSQLEAHELAQSIVYTLGRGNHKAALAALASTNVVGTWTTKRHELETSIPQTMELWRETVSTMPPIRNIALRDTLASIEGFPQRYDTFFAAHEIPCSIDYPLVAPISEQLQGLDYMEAWLTQLLAEARFLAHFDLKEMMDLLEGWCPDHRGLLINLYEPIHNAWLAGKLRARSFLDDAPQALRSF